MQKNQTQFLTLDTYLASRGTVSLDEASEMCLRILNVLMYCHDRNMTHSHLRPDQIVMCDGRPVLIDFSFPITMNGHANGNGNGKNNNSFLELPEYQVNIRVAERNDRVSDVTAVAGLFFYMLTREEPGTLKDREGRMPHQRPSVRNKLMEVSQNKLFLVNQIFDRAFQWSHAERYQTSQDLITDLERLKAYSKAELSASSLDELLKNMRSTNQSQTVTPHEMRLQTAFNGLQMVFSELATALEPDFREMEAGYRKEVLRPVYTAFVKFNYRLVPDARLTMRFRLEIVGSELVVSVQVARGAEETVEELFRTEHNAFYDSSPLEKIVRNFLAFNLATLLTAKVSS
jgi:serine/threonine-protein kinase